MSAEKIEAQETPKEPTERVVIQISLTKQGQVKVEGLCLNDKTMTYGLLEMAKEAVYEMHKKSKESQIFMPTHRLTEHLRGFIKK